MKAIALSATVTPEGNLSVTDSLRHLLPPGKATHVIVLITDGVEDEAWSRHATEQFLSSYAGTDWVYDRT
jgi:hypothetical protein